MQLNISCLIKACEQNAIKHQIYDDNGHCLMVDDQWFFQINRTPFNTQSTASLCTDKEQQYQVFKDKLNIPKSMGFMDFSAQTRYDQYLKYKSLAQIIDAVETHFHYPLVIKPNRGALGVNVSFCHNQQQAIEAIKTIFTRDRAYDYVALVQQYIKPKQEIRVIFFDGEPVLSYERFFEKSDFGAKYWETEDGKALPLNDNPIVQRAAKEFGPALNSLPGLRFVGLDIVLDEQDQLHVLELNSGPKVNHFAANNGEEGVVQMYSKILQKITGQTSKRGIWA